MALRFTIPLFYVSPWHHEFYGFIVANSEFRVLGMPKDPEEKYYQILVTIEGYEYEGYQLRPTRFTSLHAQVYVSRVSKWDRPVERFRPATHITVLNVALFGDVLQFLVMIDRRRFRDYRIMDDLMLFSTYKDYCNRHAWESQGRAGLDVPKGDSEPTIVTAHIFVARGRLVFVAAVPLQTTHNRFGKWKSIIMWELLEGGKKWVRTSTQIDLREFDPRSSQEILDSSFFVPDGDCLYFGSNTGKFVRMNALKKACCLLPLCPGGFLPDLGIPAATEARSKVFVYQPDFDLVAYIRTSNHCQKG